MCFIIPLILIKHCLHKRMLVLSSDKSSQLRARPCVGWDTSLHALWWVHRFGELRAGTVRRHTRRGAVSTRERRSTFGGVGTMKSDSQSATHRSKSGFITACSNRPSQDIGSDNHVPLERRLGLPCRSIYPFNKPVKVLFTLVHCGKYCTRVWSRG